MDHEAAQLAVDSAKDTQLITLNKLLTPPELGTGSRSGSDSDDAEAQLEPYAFEHDAAQPAAGPQESLHQGQRSAQEAAPAEKAASQPAASRAPEGGSTQVDAAKAAGTGPSRASTRASTEHAAAELQGGSNADVGRTSSSAASMQRSKRDAADALGSSAADMHDVRAAEAVVRSTMLPTQVTLPLVYETCAMTSSA